MQIGGPDADSRAGWGSSVGSVAGKEPFTSG